MLHKNNAAAPENLHLPSPKQTPLRVAVHSHCICSGLTAAVAISCAFVT